jgi:hypothetical protein
VTIGKGRSTATANIVKEWLLASSVSRTCRPSGDQIMRL